MIGNDFCLVSSVINKSIDDEFALLGLIEGKRNFEFLVYGIGYNFGLHGGILIYFAKITNSEDTTIRQATEVSLIAIYTQVFKDFLLFKGQISDKLSEIVYFLFDLN